MLTKFTLDPKLHSTSDLIIVYLHFQPVPVFFHLLFIFIWEVYNIEFTNHKPENDTIGLVLFLFVSELVKDIQMALIPQEIIYYRS